eukprot:gene3160-2142_t
MQLLKLRAKQYHICQIPSHKSRGKFQQHSNIHNHQHLIVQIRQYHANLQKNQPGKKKPHQPQHSETQTNIERILYHHKSRGAPTPVDRKLSSASQPPTYVKQLRITPTCVQLGRYPTIQGTQSEVSNHTPIHTSYSYYSTELYHK